MAPQLFGQSSVARRGVGAVLHRLTDLLFQRPACVICGRGPASAGWTVDPTGRIAGRCPGCIGESKGPQRQATSAS